MKQFCAIGLMLTCGWQGLSAAGPLERSIAREASRLASDTWQPRVPGWEAVMTLEPGAAIAVATDEGTLPGQLVDADTSSVRVRRGDVVETVAVDDVLFVVRRVRRGSGVAGTFGALGGVWLGSVVAYAISEHTRCYNGCGGAMFGAWTAFAGIPIATGYGAWRASSRMTDEVIYRRPPRARR